MSGWYYSDGKRWRRISPEASARMDDASRRIWRAFDDAFDIARSDVPKAAPGGRPGLWRWLAGLSATAWMAALLWLDRYGP